ncbi:MAG: hypothetical protein ACYDAZ_09300, partial [Thermoplasmataceae archaeon]
EAQVWLRDFLTEGPQTQREVKEAADAHCHSWATVKRAQKALGIESYREGTPGKRGGGIWFWALSGALRCSEILRCSTLSDEHLNQNEHLNHGEDSPDTPVDDTGEVEL